MYREIRSYANSIWDDNNNNNNVAAAVVVVVVITPLVSNPKKLQYSTRCIKKNMNASKPSNHQSKSLGGKIGCSRGKIST